MRETVGIADRGGRAFTLLDGPDAVTFLQGMVTNDVDAIAVGSAAYALLLTPKARVVADMRLTRLGETTFLADADPAAAAALRTVLTRYRLASKVAIEACDDAVRHRRRGGPAGRRCCWADALGAPPRPTARRARAPSIALDGRRRARAALGVLRRAGVRADRAARPCSTTAWRRLAARRWRGTTGGVFGDEAFDVLRVEAGVPRFGAEIDEQVMPAEAGVVDRAVSFTKGCYIGQEPVARLHYRGHANRGPARRSCSTASLPAAGAHVQVEGREVGRITSAVDVADARAGGGARDRAARGRSRPARRRRHGRRRARGRALRRPRVPVARLRC